MQNRYVGDIGDFAKYGLLRSLGRGARGWQPQIAVVWYLVPDETDNSDGRHVRYLTREGSGVDRWQRCDPDLYSKLKRLVADGQRSVAQVARIGLLPGAAFFTRPLAFEADQSRESRAARREDWLGGALATCAGRDVVFLDPDNGLEVSVGRLRKRGPKYTYFDDLRLMASEDRSLIVYQHATRNGTVLEQIRERLRQLKEVFRDRDPFGLYFRRVSPRAFLVVPAGRHDSRLRECCNTFLDSGWGTHFVMVDSDGGR